MMYTIIAVPSVGDPKKQMWYPGHVTGAYLHHRRGGSEIVLAYRFKSLRTAARIAVDLVRGMGNGDYPEGFIISRDAFKPVTGDVLISMVVQLAGAADTDKHPPFVGVSHFPESALIRNIPQVSSEGYRSYRHMETYIRAALAAQLF